MKLAPLKISLFVIITMSILVVLLTVLGYKNLLNFLGVWNQSNKMSLYLKVDSTTDDQNEVISFLKEFSAVSEVNLIDRTQAGKDFQNTMKEFSSGLLTEDEMIDLIPVTIEVDLQKSLNLSARESTYSELSDKLKKFSQIEEITFSASWLKKFEQLDLALRSAGFFVFLVLVAAISYLVGLMVRAFIEESKQEIEVYSLLGATRWSIYRYFLKDITIFMCLSFLLSCLFLFGLFVLIRGRLSSSEATSFLSENIQFLGTSDFLFVFLFLSFFIFLNSFLTIQSSVNRLNQLSYD